MPGTALAQPLFELDGSGNLIQRNLVALDPAGVDAVLVQGTVSSLTQGDTDTFVAYDNLGTPRDDVSSTGALVNHRVFSVFGQDVYDTNPSVVNWAGFAGGHVDPNTGLVSDYHRWYDPATGRWISDDPAGFRAQDSNLQRYDRNSVLSGADRDGLGPTFRATSQPTLRQRMRWWWQSREELRQRRRQAILRAINVFEWETDLELQGGGIPLPIEIDGSATIIGTIRF